MGSLKVFRGHNEQGMVVDWMWNKGKREGEEDLAHSGLGWLKVTLTSESLWDGEQHGGLGPRCGVWERKCVSVQDMLNFSGIRP